MAKDRRTTINGRKRYKQKLRHKVWIAILGIVAGALLIASTVFEADTPVDGTPTPTTTATVATVSTTALPTTTTTATTVVTTTTAPAEIPWNLRLVNQWHPMTQEEADSLPITDFAGGEYCDERIVSALNAMLEAGSEYGLYVTSAYRSYSLQERLYNNKVDRVIAAEGCSYEEALEIAATVVARPGTSEHNTGLAVDLLYDGCWTLEREWENGEAFDWMMANCHEYGFILRFPESKQDITGVIYEPWHYRYVGVEAATEIMSRGITLEEYVQEKGLQ